MLPTVSPSASSNKTSVKISDANIGVISNNNNLLSNAIIKTVSPQMPIVSFDRINKIKRIHTWSSKEVKEWINRLNLSK